MSSRPYRRFEGICYPNVLRGNSRPQQIKASLNDPHEYYHDEAIKLREGDVSRFIGKNICVEHDTEFVVGTISDAWVDSSGHMRATGRVYTDSDEGRDLFKAITTGDMGCLSVNYTVPKDDNGMTYGYKVPKEISVVERPFFEGAEICVTASNRSKERSDADRLGNTNPKTTPKFGVGGGGDRAAISIPVLSSSLRSSDKMGIEMSDYKSNSNSVGVEKKVIQLEIMAEEQPKKPSEESELLKHHDELLKKMEEMQKNMADLKQKASRADELEQMEQKRREQYALEQVPILKEVLEIQADQMKEQFGADYKIPTDYIQALSETFASPESKDNAAIIVASARSYRKTQEEKKKIETQLSEMNEKISKLTQDQSASSLYFDAIKRQQMITDIPDPIAKEVSIEASGGGKKYRSMFVPTSAPQPSAQERQLYERATGKSLDVSVVAGSNGGFSKVLPEIPNHNQEHKLPNSMRQNKNGGSTLFRLITSNSFDHIGVDTRSQTIEVEDK